MNKFRHDGSFVIEVNGLPYHTVKGDNYFNATEAEFNNAPSNFEPEETDEIKFVNGEWVDITNSDEYKEKKTQQKIEIQKQLLQDQIDEIDRKTIRALREGGIKDESTGQTWLDFYTSQIKSLRAELSQFF